MDVMALLCNHAESCVCLVVPERASFYSQVPLSYYWMICHSMSLCCWPCSLWTLNPGRVGCLDVVDSKINNSIIWSSLASENKTNYVIHRTGILSNLTATKRSYTIIINVGVHIFLQWLHVSEFSNLSRHWIVVNINSTVYFKHFYYSLLSF